MAKARGFDETLRNAHDFDLWLRILDKPKVRFSVLQCGHALCHIVEGSVTSYTSRRLNCGMAVARRNILGLWNRSVFQVGNYFYRLTAIQHMEAFLAHNKRSEFGAALSVLLRLGGRIFIGPIEVVSALGVWGHRSARDIRGWR